MRIKIDYIKSLKSLTQKFIFQSLLIYLLIPCNVRVLRVGGLCGNTVFKSTRVSIQNSIINYTTTMPSNCARINIDLVQKTQYNVPLNKTAKTAPPKLQPLPKFEPLHINNQDHYGLLNLPLNVDIHNPFGLFSLFFMDEIVNKLIEWINRYAELYPLDKEKENLYIWQPICKQELYAYFRVFIYMGLTIELAIEGYWKDLNTHGTEHIIK